MTAAQHSQSTQSKDARSSIDETVADRLAIAEPEVELVAVEHPGSQTLRIFIDRPEGVDLELCERVTMHLRDLLSEYSLEVSSPGADRPLTKPEHYRRFAGERVRIRTAEPIDGRSNFNGTIADSDEQSVAIEAEDSTVQIPLDLIRKSNLVREFGFGGEA